MAGKKGMKKYPMGIRKEVMEKGKYGTVICQDCRQEMSPGYGCSILTIRIGNKYYERIKAGDSLDLLPDMKPYDICYDCNVRKGQYHHFGCEMERCPSCLGQLFCCDCENKYLINTRTDTKINKSA